MAKQVININSPADLINVGVSANDSRGDPLRSAFIKLNDAIDKIDSNFNELYTEIDVHDYLGNFTLVDNILSVDNSDAVVITSKISPTINLTIDNITKSNPCEVFASPTSGTLWSAVADGYRVKFTGITTMTELNDNSYYIEESTTNSFFLYTDENRTQAVDSTNFTVYSSSPTRTATNIAISGGTEFRADITATPNIVDVQVGWTVVGAGLSGTQTVSSVLTTGNTYYIEIPAGVSSFVSTTAYTFTSPVVIDGGGTCDTSIPGNDVTLIAGGNSSANTGKIYGDVNLTGNNISLTADSYSIELNNNGVVSLPSTNNNYLAQGRSRTRTIFDSVDVGTPKIVWTSTETFISSAKLLIQVEGKEDGDNDWNTQSCEAVIAAKGMHGSGDPSMTIYAIIHTSIDNLTSFTVQRNSTSNLIEILATPSATSTAATQQKITIHSTELICWD